jgi:hypothetical protein
MVVKASSIIVYKGRPKTCNHIAKALVEGHLIKTTEMEEKSQHQDKWAFYLFFFLVFSFSPGLNIY